jgi:hypothetical protein
LPANGFGTWFRVRTTAGRPDNFIAHPLSHLLLDNSDVLQV